MFSNLWPYHVMWSGNIAVDSFIVHNSVGMSDSFGSIMSSSNRFLHSRNWALSVSQSSFWRYR